MSGTQKFAYQNWPDKIFPSVNLVFGQWSLWSGRPPILLRCTAILILPRGWARGHAPP